MNEDNLGYLWRCLSITPLGRVLKTELETVISSPSEVYLTKGLE